MIVCKKRFVVGLIAGCLTVTGCSGGGNIATDNNYKAEVSESYDAISDEFESGIAPSDVQQEEKKEEKVIQQREMLIYSCDVQIDTLDYEKSVRSFKQSLRESSDFVEEEQYSDGANSYGYYVEESEKKKTYTATVRIPSEKYDAFVNSMGDLGDVRNQSSTVQNVSQEYHDNNIQLEILEAKERVFLKMLKKAVTTEEMLSIENSLTSLQVQIEQLKTRQTELETDVAYSFVNISILEVEKYQEKPKETDTFVKRLRITVTESAKGFLVFLEWLLFLVIRLFPYAVIGFVIWNVVRVWRRKHPKRVKKKEVYQAPKYETKSVNSLENSEQEEKKSEG